MRVNDRCNMAAPPSFRGLRTVGGYDADAGGLSSRPAVVAHARALVVRPYLLQARIERPLRLRRALRRGGGLHFGTGDSERRDTADQGGDGKSARQNGPV